MAPPRFPPPPPAGSHPHRSTKSSSGMDHSSSIHRKQRSTSLLKSISRRNSSSSSSVVASKLPQTATSKRLEAMLDRDENLNSKKNKAKFHSSKEKERCVMINNKRPRERSVNRNNPYFDTKNVAYDGGGGGCSDRSTQKRPKTSSSSISSSRSISDAGSEISAKVPKTTPTLQTSSSGIGRSFTRTKQSSSSSSSSPFTSSAIGSSLMKAAHTSNLMSREAKMQKCSNRSDKTSGSSKSDKFSTTIAPRAEKSRRISTSPQRHGSRHHHHYRQLQEYQTPQPKGIVTVNKLNYSLSLPLEHGEGKEGQQQDQAYVQRPHPPPGSKKNVDEMKAPTSTFKATATTSTSSLHKIGLSVTMKTTKRMQKTAATANGRKNQQSLSKRILSHNYSTTSNRYNNSKTENSFDLKSSIRPQGGVSIKDGLDGSKVLEKVSRSKPVATTMTQEQPTAQSRNSEAFVDFNVLPPPRVTSSKDASNSRFATGGFRRSGMDAEALSKEMTQQDQKKSTTLKKKANNNENFVRLNLKNNAGACRGARNKKKNRRGFSNMNGWSSKNRTSDDGENEEGDDDAGDMDESFVVSSSTTSDVLIQLLDKRSRPSTFNDRRQTMAKTSYDQNDNDSNSIRMYDSDTSSITSKTSATGTKGTVYVSKMSGIDPLDEFVDGQFHMKTKHSKQSPHPQLGTQSVEVPKCARHQRPCKLNVVKKNTTGNKGRKFFTCSMPRGEQCNHFQWADDTVESARELLSKNGSHSSFIARQVASHVDRFRVLTVPELREELERRKLNKNGKKQQLLMRLAIWARDEIVKSSPEFDGSTNDEEDTIDLKKKLRVINEEDDYSHDENDDSSSSSSSSSSSDEELEFWDESKAVPAEFKPRADGESNPNDEVVNEEDSALKNLRSIFGYENFRDGQEWAIHRCLRGKRSLLIAPTGFGKSLCYALPAAMMEGVCIVVSPLISLIQDQLRSLPPRIPAATLSGSMSASMTAAVLDDVARTRIKILFVSPERLTSPAFQRLFNKTWNPATKMRERKFPPISLLCVDEAHTISQWGHNFRPCFIRVRNLVKIMEPKSILAITATAGPKVIEDIQKTLQIAVADESSDSTQIITRGRDNIDVMCKFVENHEDRLTMLQKILMPCTDQSEDEKARYPYCGSMSTGSVIIYVWRQIDTEVLAESLISAGVSGGVVVYHGGMDASSRSRSQSRFMRGKARICVATVAFGLGIDKADIEGIVHLYLSNSPEHFLQEIGRAGRDGRRAKAISLPLTEEVPVRHSFVHSTLVSKSQIRSLLRILRSLIIMASDSEGCRARIDDPHGIVHIAVPIQSTILACDCKSETIETFLSLIELEFEEDPVLLVEGFNFNSATIALKKRSLQKLSEREPLAATILDVAQCVDPPISSTASQNETISEMHADNDPSTGFQKQFLAYSRGSYAFSITNCANHLGPTAEPRHVFAALRRLQSSNELELALDTTEKGRVFHVKVTAKGVAAFSEEEFEAIEERITSKLFDSFSSSNAAAAEKVLDMNRILREVAKTSALSADSQENGKSQSLRRFQELVQRYFDDLPLIEEVEGRSSSDSSLKIFCDVREKELEIDIFSLVRDLPYCTPGGGNEKMSEAVNVNNSEMIDYTALAVTKFLHGIDTPRCPARNFRSHALFGKWRVAKFSVVLEAVENALRLKR